MIRLLPVLAAAALVACAAPDATPRRAETSVEAACRAEAERVMRERSRANRDRLDDFENRLGTRSFEAQQIRALGHIIRNGHLYKGAKPVHWCLDCRSSLAEAEVEYEDKTSPSIDVEFRVHDTADRGPSLASERVEESAQCLFVGHVDGRDVHAGTKGLEAPAWLENPQVIEPAFA